jgi:hypothetical protein
MLYAIFLGLVLLSGLAAAVGCRQGLICAASGAIDLTAVTAQVRFLTLKGATGVVPPAASRTMGAGDAIDIDDHGEARLRFQDFLTVRIFRNAGILIEGEADPSAPAIFRYRLKAGTTLNTLSPQNAAQRRLRITTQWAVIEDQGTEFLAYFDPQTQWTWAVVVAGTLKVSGAGGEVIVPAGMQTWVEPNKPPEQPHPATRAAVGNRFPLIDILTGNAIPDGQLLSGAPLTPTAAVSPTGTPTDTPTASATPFLTGTP